MQLSSSRFPEEFSPAQTSKCRLKEKLCSNRHILNNSLKKIVFKMFTKLRGLGQTCLCFYETSLLLSGFFPAPLYRVSPNPQVPRPIVLSKSLYSAPGWDVTAKINTLMDPFCFEIWIYYKWVPDKQTHGRLSPPLRRPRRLAKLTRKQCHSESSKGAANPSHVMCPHHIHQLERAALRGLDKIYISLDLTWNYLNLRRGINPPTPILICW